MRTHTRRGANVVGLAAAVVLVSGCATMKPMALSKETQAVALDQQQSLALATVKVANVYKTGSQPHVKYVWVKSIGEKSETLGFEVATPFLASPIETDQFEEVLVSLSLVPGAYELTSVGVTAGSPLMQGSGTAAINSTFRIGPGKAVYLGRIEAVRRERTGDELRAGSVIPLINQSVTGFSGGTFDIRIIDRYDQDLALMRTEFPPLRGIAVEKQILPPPAPPAPPSPPAQQEPAEQ